MSSMSFATCCKKTAERFLDKPAFDWVKPTSKEYVLNNLADPTDEGLITGFRVLDPDFHAARVKTANVEMVQEFQRLQDGCDVEMMNGENPAKYLKS